MHVNGVPYRTVWMEGGTVRLIDQRRLPFRFELLSLTTSQETADAIREMAVRGAGAIGVAAGYAMAQAVWHASEQDVNLALARAASVLRATRPTARNLFYAVDRVLDGVRAVEAFDRKRTRAVEIAQALADEDAKTCERIGELGQSLLGSATTVLTHCNAGWLAFTDWGTALAPIYRAHRNGKRVAVYVTETRPRAQGAKLTAWELAQEGIPYTLIPDTAAGSVMRQGLIDLVIVGADRIAANGDVANKIGTYTLAVLARTHRIPLYVAAPTSTVDVRCPSGDAIPIEQRADDEVTWVDGMTASGQLERVRISPEGCAVRNWAFDVTPAEYLTGLLTERGLIAAHPHAIDELMRQPIDSSTMTP
ncbi:MAG: S-methyl-5-thioribose-1-phosphate isomerase [Candidatus Omnitrophica bacterium]|nr:S-methyl-5-thioribose-1-phosphate isomerase [Candidatus Omnitrophota bacterium]